MANYCDFDICVFGEPDLLDRFAGYFANSMAQGPENDRNEFCIRLDNGTFGDYDDNDDDVPWLCLSKDSFIRRIRGEYIQVVGWCKWTAPIKWLEQVSNLMPGIIFSVRATIEHELFQQWEVANGHGQLTHEEIVPLI